MISRASQSSVGALFEQLCQRNFSVLQTHSIEAEGGRELAAVIAPHLDMYEPLILATASQPRRWYDWNLGFILPHLNLEAVIDVLAANQSSLCKSEAIAWALGEAGSDDDRIVDFLYFVCEECKDYDAWWCAAEALEKLGFCDATDLKKRTLKGTDWDSLDWCLSNLAQRPAVIGVLRLATLGNTDKVIIPKCRSELKSVEFKAVQNAVWLLERLRVDDSDTLSSLHDLYLAAEDRSHTLRPRVVEAFGQIAAPATRGLLEDALSGAEYYRTRAYAARGLGKIGDYRSLPILEQALNAEDDARVLRYISDAIYAIKTPSKRALHQLNRDLRWPENGMIVDHSNDWYANPQVYDKFSYAEDPLGLSLEFAISQLPVDACCIADVGTGTGRFARFLAEKRPQVERIFALDGNWQMCRFLGQQIKFAPGVRKRILPIHGDLSTLPFADESLDAVISSWAFPSKMWDPAVCLRQTAEVRRVLKKNGLLVTVGWDETFRDQLSELWYRFVPEPDFRRESIEEWRKRRRMRIRSPRNCHLTFVRQSISVPLLFNDAKEAAAVLGYLFGFSAGEWVSQQQRCEFSIHIGITCDDTVGLDLAIEKLEREVELTTKASA